MFIDFKTTLIIVIILTAMLSAMLLLARSQVKNINGLGFLALGNLASSCGMVVLLTQTGTALWHNIPGNVLIAAGFGLYINGIQAFLDAKPRTEVVIALIFAIICGDLFFVFNGQQVRLAMVFNTLVYLFANLYCASLLLRKTSYPINLAFQFTGLIFLIMSFVLVSRATSIIFTDEAMIRVTANWSVNKLSFIWMSIFQLCITFGFMLMLNYRMARNLTELAAFDWLTGVLNRRYLESSAKILEANCKRLNVGLGLLLIDLDHFKQINDQYGHQAGDAVLKHFAAHLKSLTRAGDLIGRYGGEEFCVLFPNLNEEQSFVLAERIRTSFKKSPCLYGQHEIYCGLSIGVSDSIAVGLNFDSLIAAADKSLYKAKQGGRDKVVSYGELNQFSYLK